MAVALKNQEAIAGVVRVLEFPIRDEAALLRNQERLAHVAGALSKHPKTKALVSEINQQIERSWPDANTAPPHLTPKEAAYPVASAMSVWSLEMAQAANAARIEEKDTSVAIAAMPEEAHELAREVMAREGIPEGSRRHKAAEGWLSGLMDHLEEVKYRTYANYTIEQIEFYEDLGRIAESEDFATGYRHARALFDKRVKRIQDAFNRVVEEYGQPVKSLADAAKKAVKDSVSEKVPLLSKLAEMTNFTKGVADTALDALKKSNMIERYLRCDTGLPPLKEQTEVKTTMVWNLFKGAVVATGALGAIYTLVNQTDISFFESLKAFSEYATEMIGAKGVFELLKNFSEVEQTVMFGALGAMSALSVISKIQGMSYGKSAVGKTANALSDMLSGKEGPFSIRHPDGGTYDEIVGPFSERLSALEKAGLITADEARAVDGHVRREGLVLGLVMNFSRFETDDPSAKSRWEDKIVPRGEGWLHDYNGKVAKDERGIEQAGREGGVMGWAKKNLRKARQLLFNHIDETYMPFFQESHFDKGAFPAVMIASGDGATIRSASVNSDGAAYAFEIHIERDPAMKPEATMEEIEKGGYPHQWGVSERDKTVTVQLSSRDLDTAIMMLASHHGSGKLKADIQSVYDDHRLMQDVEGWKAASEKVAPMHAKTHHQTQRDGASIDSSPHKSQM